MRFPLQWADGVNLNADPKAIRDTQLAKATNVMPTLEGLMDKREPVIAVRQATQAGLSWRPITLFTPDPVTGFDFILHYHDSSTGERLLASTLDMEPTVPTSPDTLAVASGADGVPASPYTFVNYRGRVIAVGGDNEGFYQLVQAGGGTWKWVKASFNWLSTEPGVGAAQSQNVSVKPRVACRYQGRMVYLNFGPGMGNWLVFADSINVDHSNTTTAPMWAVIGDDALADNGRHLELAAIQGENIIAAEEVTLMAVGSAIQTAMLVLTERSAVLCTGQPAQTTDSSFTEPAGYIADFQANKVNYEVGAVSPSCITRTKYGTFWASKDDVWMLAGNAPVKVGTNISPALRSCPPSMRRWWSMSFANDILYLSIVTQNTGNPYNLTTQHWRLDLRQGVPQSAADARWWGPQDYEGLIGLANPETANGSLCHSLVTKRDADERDVVYSCIRADTMNDPALMLIAFNQPGIGPDAPYVPVLSGRPWGAGETVAVGDVVKPSVYQYKGELYVCKTAGVTGVAEPTWGGGGVDTTDGTAVWVTITDPFYSMRTPATFGDTVDGAYSTDIRFKDHSFGEPARDKVARRGDVVALAGARTRIDMPVSVNGGDLSKRLGPATIGNPTLNEGGNNANNELGSLTLGESAAAEEYQARSLKPSTVTDRDVPISENGDSEGVVRGRQLQFRLRDGTGFVIDETNNYIVFGAAKDELPTMRVITQATIATGYYETVDDLLTAIVAAMNAVGVNIVGTVGGWGFDSAFDAIYPYMTTLTKTFSGVGRDYAVLFFAAEDCVNGGTTYYTSRSQRLLAMLGYDTSNEYGESVIGTITVGGVDLGCIGEATSPLETVSPTVIAAQQSIPPKNTSTLSVSEVSVDVHLKAGLPLSSRSR